MKSEFKLSSLFRHTAVAAAVALSVNVGYAQDSGYYSYNQEFSTGSASGQSTDVVYRAPQYENRPATVHTPTSIQGCDAGLIVVSGAYKCKSLALVSVGGLIPDPVVIVSGYGGSSRQPGAYLGSDGRMYSDANQTQLAIGGPDTSYHIISTTYQADAANSLRDGGGGGGGGGGRVICTHFYKNGEIERDVWKADLKFTRENLSATTVRGYHFWAIPYVKLMRRNKLAEQIMRPIALWRAQELAFQMGVVKKGSIKGKLVRLVLEPVCYAIGCIAEQKDFDHLWTDADRAQFLAA